MIKTNTILININNIFEKKIWNLDSDGLNSEASIVLFFFYYYKYSKNEVYFDKAINNLQNIFKKIDNGDYGTNFYDGIVGIGWMIDHLTENNFIETKINSKFSNFFDYYFHQKMLDYLFSRNFDYHNGALGFGFYFIKRYENEKSIDLKLKYYDYLAHFVFFIENQRIIDLKDINHKNNVFNNEIQLSNLINFLLLLTSMNICKKIVYINLEFYSNILFRMIKDDQFFKIDSILCLWKSGILLNNKKIIEGTNLIFQKNLFYNETQNIINYFKIFRSYDLVFKTTENEIYKIFLDKYHKRLEKYISSLDCSKFGNGLWGGLSGVGLCIMTLENDFVTNWDDCLIMK